MVLPPRFANRCLELLCAYSGLAAAAVVQVFMAVYLFCQLYLKPIQHDKFLFKEIFLFNIWPR